MKGPGAGFSVSVISSSVIWGVCALSEVPAVWLERGNFVERRRLIFSSGELYIAYRQAYLGVELLIWHCLRLAPGLITGAELPKALKRDLAMV
jgi:hypothetical protein